MNYLSMLRAVALCLSLGTSVAQAVTCAANIVAPFNPDSAYTANLDPTVTVNQDNTVTHLPTGLVWKRCSEGQSWDGATCTGNATTHTWAEALTLADSSSFAGQSDWRLPNIKELLSLAEKCRYQPSINDTIFPATPSSSFWSGSPSAQYSASALVVFFQYGGSTGIVVRSSNYVSVRLVRGGQSFDSLGSAITVTGSGTGSGTVTSGETPSPHINCSITAGVAGAGSCSYNEAVNTTVTLTAAPASGSTFTGWTAGICTNADADSTGICQVTMDAGKTVDATFSITQVPGEPTNVSAVAGNAQATVTFSAPTSSGSSAITGYTVTSSPAGGVDANAGSTALTHTITGLVNGTSYTFTVKANSAAGAGAESAPSAAVVPSGPATAQIVRVYPDSNMTDQRTYKHHGDLLRIVVAVDSLTGATSTGTLRLDIGESSGAGVDSSWTPRVYKRLRGNLPSYEYVGGVLQILKTGWTSNRLEVDYSLAKEDISAEYVFIVKLRNDSSDKFGVITANASIVGGAAPKSLTSLVMVGGSRRIMLTNETAMYKKFTDGDFVQAAIQYIFGINSVSNFFSTLYAVAADANAVVIPVDLYDFMDGSSNPTLTWTVNRTNLPYDNNSGNPPVYAGAEVAVNAAALKTKEILDKVLADSHADIGREVAIIGDDSIIPHYRLPDPDRVPFECKSFPEIKYSLSCLAKEGYFNDSPISKRDGENGYLYTDLRYRTDAGLRDQPIYIGRIIGADPGKMANFLKTSNADEPRIGRALKLEIDQFNGEWSWWEGKLKDHGYEILKSINGHNTDLDCGLAGEALGPVGGDCFKEHWNGNEGSYADAATESDFTDFFSKGQTFDLYFGIGHGGNGKIASSITPGNAHTFFSNQSLDNIHFDDKRNFHPFFLLESCLVGIVGDAPDSFMNRLVNTGIRGAAAFSTSIYPSRSDNETGKKFAEEAHNGSAGRGLTAYTSLIMAQIDKYNRNDRKEAEQIPLATVNRVSLNLFGLPWVKVSRTAPPTSGAQARSKAQRMAVPRPTTVINENLGAVSIIAIAIDGLPGAILSVPGFGQNSTIASEPVLPYKEYEFTLPADAAVSGVTVQFLQNESLGVVNLPGFKKGRFLPDPFGTSDRYVSLTPGTGVFPSSKHEYFVTNLGDKVVVRVRVIPFEYDRVTQVVTVYKQFSLNVNYTSASGVVFNGANFAKGTYYSGEAMPLSVALTNTQSGAAAVSVEYKVRDAEDTLVATGTESVDLAGYEEGDRAVNLVAPAVVGPVTVQIRVLRDGVVLGATERIVRVVNVALENLTVPAFVAPGTTVPVSAVVHNFSPAAVSGTVNFVLYRDGQELAQLGTQAVTNLAAGASIGVTTNWTPGQDLAGSHLTVGTSATINGAAISATPVGTYVGTFHQLSGTASPGAGGSISCNTPVATGSTGSCYVTANIGYLVGSVTSSCGGTLTEAVFTTGALAADCSVNASFVSNMFALTVAKTGSGSGTVSSNFSGINCGASCIADYVNGQTVTLTATPATGSTFIGWSVACSGTGSCVVNMAAAQSVTASFMNASSNAPVCNLSASPALVMPGASSTLTASCSPAATSYAWTGAGCAGITTATCTMNPAVTTAYTVAGTNADGTGPAGSATVTINATKIVSSTSPAGGPIKAEFSGGNANCFFATTAFTTPTAPAGVSMPHGAFGFTTTDCGANAPLSFTISYPQALPVGTKYYKFGPTGRAPAGEWYELTSASLSSDRTQFTFTITDNGVGDSNPAVGFITDPGGPGFASVDGATSIPTLSEWGMILLSGLLAVFGLRQVRRRGIPLRV